MVLLMASINRKNNYSKQILFQCGDLADVKLSLRSTVINLSLNYHLAKKTKSVLVEQEML